MKAMKFCSSVPLLDIVGNAAHLQGDLGVVPTALHPTPAFSLPSHSPDPESLPGCALHTHLPQSWLRGFLTMPGGIYRPASNPKGQVQTTDPDPWPQTLEQSSGYCAPGPGQSPGTDVLRKGHLYSLPMLQESACTPVHPHTHTHTKATRVKKPIACWW